MNNSADKNFLSDVGQYPDETKRKLARYFSVGSMEDTQLTPTDLKCFSFVSEKLRWQPMVQLCNDLEQQLCPDDPQTQTVERFHDLPTYFVIFARNCKGKNCILVMDSNSVSDVHQTTLKDNMTYVQACCIRENDTPVVCALKTCKNNHIRFCKYDILTRKWTKNKLPKHWHGQPILVSLGNSLYVVVMDKTRRYALEKYQSPSEKWTKVVDLGQHGGGCVCIEHNGRLHIFIGSTELRYNPATNDVDLFAFPWHVKDNASAVSSGENIVISQDNQQFVFNPSTGWSVSQWCPPSVGRICKTFQIDGRSYRVSLCGQSTAGHLDLSDLQEDLSWRRVLNLPSLYSDLTAACIVQYPRKCPVLGVPFMKYMY